MKAWHKIVTLREDVRQGTLALSEFAADLDAVMTKNTAPQYAQYVDPARFFEITHATESLTNLATEICERLQGKSEKAVRQLAMTYGGGKSHSLILLYHLVSNPDALPDYAAVRAMLAKVGGRAPRARVAALLGDKIDVERGMEVVSPSGQSAWLRELWSILAWQIAGEDGLRILRPDTPFDEREEPPAEGLIKDVLGAAGVPVLVLVDELLMYGRGKARQDDSWVSRLQDFFQYLTQAVVATPKCAMVASLLSTNPDDNDEIGRLVQSRLEQVFTRELAGVPDLPVEQKDVPEVLRRRLFELDTVSDPDAWRPEVHELVQQLARFDEQVSRDPSGAEEAFVQAYPFHPDLMAVLYGRWTQLHRFQRTRGVLRTFAQALRDSAGWDTSPVVTTTALLNPVGDEPISKALLELTGIASAGESADSRFVDWQAIVRRELEFGAEIQKKHTTSFPHRELEAAVLTVFLHSQPIGQKARTVEMMRMAGVTLKDRISFEQALKEWAERSWHLDDELIPAPRPGETELPLPGEWRLGPDPNLKQMHAQSKEVLAHKTQDVDREVIAEVKVAPALTQGASQYVTAVHNVPEQPHGNDNFPPDDDQFHYVILRPEAACTAGAPSEIARRMIEQSTSVDRKRAHTNLLVLLAPTPDGVTVIRDKVLDRMAWDDVARQLTSQLNQVPKDHERDREQYEERIKRANISANTVKMQIPGAVKSAYCIGVTVNEDGIPEAQSFQPGTGGTFGALIADRRFRIQTEAMNPEALLPGGEFQVWHEDDPSRRVADLVSVFSQTPALPKIVRPSDVYETIAKGAEDGMLVLRLRRPDGSVRTWWHERCEPATMKDRELEAWLPEKARLTSLPAALLAPERLPGLWHEDELPVAELRRYFGGEHTVQIEVYEGYTEARAIPQVSDEILGAAIVEAVRAKQVWLYGDGVSLYGEPADADAISDSMVLLRKPKTLGALELERERIPAAWTEKDTATVEAIYLACKNEKGQQLPWTCIRPAIVAMVGSGRCKLEGAAAVAETYDQAKNTVLTLQGTTPTRLKASAALAPHEIIDLAEKISELHVLATDAQATPSYMFTVEVDAAIPPEEAQKLDEILGQVCKDLRLVPPEGTEGHAPPRLLPEDGAA